MDSNTPFMTIRTRRPANDRDASSMSMSSSADSAYGSSSESCSPATHDISRVSYHVKHLESFAQALQDSASRAFPNRGPTQRYTKVHALMLHWKSDDLFVLPELEDLEKCLREDYNYETDIFSIPSENSHLELMLKVGDLVKQYESEETLFIVYYGGHAKIDESRMSTWCANRRPDSPWLQWSAIQTLLERSISDVLILLDCCAGAASATFPTGQSITETISASSWDAIAPDPGRYSFTNALIEVLEEWRHKAFSAAMLHAEVLARLKHPRPILINGKHFEARSTPVHFMMTSNYKAPSIEICRLVPPPPSESSSRRRLLDSAMPGGRGWGQRYPSASDNMIPSTSEPNEDEPHVMISLALEDDQRLDMEAWEEWLAGFPALAKYVKVQGIFKSHSTLLLLSLPVMVWDFLPDDPACAFVAFIRSNNLLHASKSPTIPAPATPSAAATVNQDLASEMAPDDGESALSGSTFTPAKNIKTTQNRQLAGDPRSSQRTIPNHRTEYTPSDSIAPTAALGQASRPLLKNMGSTTSLSTTGWQTRPSSLSGPDSSSHNEPISRTMLITTSKGSKRSIFHSDQEVPQGQPMADHVVRRLEEYFFRDPDPNLGVTEHLASHLGVETSDIHVWFHHRREQEKLNHNLQSLRAVQSQQPTKSRTRMILPGHLNSLLEIYPSKGILIVDLRSSTDFERSHIHDALNLRAPLSFVQNTSLEMIEDTFMDDQSRRSFSKWLQCRCVVFYDRVVEFDWECPVADALCDKFKKKGWQGQCFILKGHYREFSASFDKYISGSKMSQEAKEYLDGLRQQSSPTEEEANQRHALYDEWLNSFLSQHLPVVDLIPSRKLERQRAVAQHQRELETQFEARFPALYRKAQAMAPRESTTSPANEDYEADLLDSMPPSPSGFIPPPPFEHRDQQGQQQFKPVKWKQLEEEDDQQFEARKGPLVEHLATGLDKMREAAGFMSSTSLVNVEGEQNRSSHSFTGVSGGGEKGKMMDYYEDYDEIDPKSEGLRDEEGFRRAGSGGFEAGGNNSMRVGGGVGERQHGISPGIGPGIGDGGGGGSGAGGQQGKVKKRGMIWERLKGGAAK
ncbi:hypothetical protein QBC38DRAFT_465860 [Podospora fimiseda]|uniref:Homeobox domain-containing protein n=1 Tax=Podospora fimiseda TaxID=252190 RepID=A0AAN7BYW4_9PEZI|nr:hypothetical protein QBC38DRAFT_465860 [Podospora fimiseda]